MTIPVNGLQRASPLTILGESRARGWESTDLQSWPVGFYNRTSLNMITYTNEGRCKASDGPVVNNFRTRAAPCQLTLRQTKW